LQGKITADEKLRLELQLALLTGNASEADRLSNELLISQARTTGLATFIANLPKALNPFADYPAYVQAALAELAKLAAGQKALQVTPTAPMKTLEQARTEAVTSVARVNEIYTDLMSKINATNKNPAPVVQNNYISGATQGLLDELNNGLINNSASGIRSSINRTNFAIQ
jgi:cell pole-organizing protein PopZ